MSNINTLLKKIKTAVYGIDVRDAIHDAIKQTYRDAIDAGNVSIEIADARGEYESLNERLNNINIITDSISLFTDIIEKAGTDINLVLEDKICFKCNSIDSLTISSSAVSDVNYRSRVVFEANKNFTVSSTNITFLGEHCKNAKLTPKEGNEYLIEFLYLDRLLGVVSCTHESDGDAGDEASPGEENTELTDFSGAAEMCALAKRWHDKRNQYLTYGQTNAFSNNGAKAWRDVTTIGVDSPDGRYRKIDCSGAVGAWVRGLEFDDIYKDELTYNTKDLSARTSRYEWAIEIPRTAAEQCKFFEEQGFALTAEQLHTTGTDYSKLKSGDIIFRGGSNNGRYKGVYHVELYYGDYTAQDGTSKKVIIEATSSSKVSKHSDGITKGIQILQFNKKSTSDIVCVARIQC